MVGEIIVRNNVALFSICYMQFLGLYDYEPLLSSASANPEFELSFKEGSLVKVFGQKMSDGYYIGEVQLHTSIVQEIFCSNKLNR